MDAEIRSHISDELNVLSLDELASAGAELVSVSVKANFKSLGARYGADVQEIAKAIAASDQTELVKTLRANATHSLSYANGKAEINLEDLVITETPKEGWSVAAHSGESVALDLTLTPELIEAGLVREVIRAIQEERKQSNFDISDRISVKYSAHPEVVSAIEKNLELICSETLATSFEKSAQTPTDANELGLWLELKQN
jgi:isoleucyl-tRNA synthetase